MSPIYPPTSNADSSCRFDPTPFTKEVKVAEKAWQPERLSVIVFIVEGVVGLFVLIVFGEACEAVLVHAVDE